MSTIYDSISTLTTNVASVATDATAAAAASTKLGTITNTGGTATVGGVLGDLAALSLASRTAAQQAALTRAAANLPQGTSAAIFTVTGPVIIHCIIGIVTTVIQSGTNNLKLIYDPTATGADTDMCATVDIDALAVGHVIAITGAVADAATKSAAPGIAVRQAGGLVLDAGSIKLSCSASKTGQIAWYVLYQGITGTVTPYTFGTA